MAGGNPAVLEHVIPDTFTGYDLFTDHVHHGTPRLPATENAPDECVICYDTTDEHLFVNPRVACRCSAAAPASCWGGAKDTRCPLRPARPPGRAQGPRARARVRVGRPRRRIMRAVYFCHGHRGAARQRKTSPSLLTRTSKRGKCAAMRVRAISHAYGDMRSAHTPRGT